MFGWLKKKSSAQGNPTDLSAAVTADLARNIKNFHDVPPECFDAIYDAALRSISAGRAVSVLSNALMKIDGMTARRAGEISLSLNNKASVILSTHRQLALGLQHATWCHSGAPCGTANAAHQAADGKTYSIAKGLLMNGKRTWPGHEDGCKCIGRTIIPGFED
jgi:hypothetical protein